MYIIHRHAENIYSIEAYNNMLAGVTLIAWRQVSIVLVVQCESHHPSCHPQSPSHFPTPKQNAAKPSYVDGDTVPPSMFTATQWFLYAILKILHFSQETIAIIAITDITRS